MPGSTSRLGVVAAKQANRDSTYGSNPEVKQSEVTERSTLNRKHLATGPSDQGKGTTNIEGLPPSRYLSAKRYARTWEWLNDLPVRRTCQIPLVLYYPSTQETFAMTDTSSTITAQTAKTGIHHQSYRALLQSNGIKMLDAYDEPPQHVQALLADVLPVEPIAITGRIETVEERNMVIRGSDEEQVKRLFQSLMTEQMDSCCILMVDDQLLDPLRVPNKLGRHRIVSPEPNTYLGYWPGLFEKRLHDLLIHTDANMASFGFLVVEVTGDGETGSDGLWVATNKCMGAASTFLNIMKTLQSALLEKDLVNEANALQPVVFSIASNGTETRLFATYAEQEYFTMYFVNGFLLYDATSRATLHSYIQHIVDWGANKRLQTIKSALQALYDSGVRIPAPPIMSGNEENYDPEGSEASESDLEMPDSPIDRPHAGRGEA
ncbi:unnamed protein product [Clonostachys byssicola]|uniref:DUF7924 domain-containing protein n=1 Tax=Clonostachys byssicola TaxID=160290 RepID=A0A9N9UHI6_9HYPO|nr:unnamed protein product [Clonostachys byssicola]